MSDEIDYEMILVKAHEMAALAVSEASGKYNEMAGACGFAWVTIEGTDGLARFCRKTIRDFAKTAGVGAFGRRDVMEKQRHYGDKGYPRGWQFWNPGEYLGQRVDIKETGARAFRDVLAEAGIRATVGSRLD